MPATLPSDTQLTGRHLPAAKASAWPVCGCGNAIWVRPFLKTPTGKTAVLDGCDLRSAGIGPGGQQVDNSVFKQMRSARHDAGAGALCQLPL